MCHVLSEGSKWSGWVRPCGLSPCAPRYYYSTPRCTLVYSLVLSSVCCAPAWCCVLCLRCSCASVLWCALCLACPACGASAWCCGCGAWVRPAPALPALCGCALRCALCSLCFSCFNSWGNTCPTYGVLYVGLIRSLYMCPVFFRLAIYDPFCTYNKKPAHGFRIWISKSRLEFSMFCFSFCGIFSR